MSDAEQLTRILPGVQASLAAMQDSGEVDVRFAASAALAVRYAELLDDAVVAQKYSRAIRMVGRFLDMQIDNAPMAQRDQLGAAWERISSALAEHTTASDLGPKLLAALDRLELTPASTPAPAAQPPGQGQVIAMPTPLQVQREAARGRYAVQD